MSRELLAHNPLPTDNQVTLGRNVATGTVESVQNLQFYLTA